MKILIEGTDYSGKSTLAKDLKRWFETEKQQSFVYYHNPKGLTPESNELYESIKNETDMREKEIKILLSHSINQKEIDSISQTQNVIVDRSIYTFYAYQMNHLNDQEICDLVYKAFDFPNFSFDAAFCLTSEKHIARLRAQKRVDNDPLDDYFLNNFFKVKRIFDCFDQTNLIDSNVKKLYDTSEMTHSDLLEKAKRTILNAKLCT